MNAWDKMIKKANDEKTKKEEQDKIWLENLLKAEHREALEMLLPR
jgi:hypothetical protein